MPNKTAKIKYAPTSKDLRGFTLAEPVLEVTITDLNGYSISFPIDNINRYVEKLNGFKEKWRLQ